MIDILFCVLPRTRQFVDETGTHTRAKHGEVIDSNKKWLGFIQMDQGDSFS